MQEIKARLLELLREKMGEEIANRAEDGDEVFASQESGSWARDAIDSLDRAEFVMACEDEFDVEIPDYAIIGMKTLNDLAKYIGVQLAEPLHGSH